MLFGIHLAKSKKIESTDLVSAWERQLLQDFMLARLAVDRGMLALEQVETVVMRSAATNMTFTEAAVELGLINDDEIAQLLILLGNVVKPIDDILIDMRAIGSEEIENSIAEFQGELRNAIENVKDENSSRIKLCP